ncbi:hypothetical protein QBC45DRAFT_404966 [Copromyces sp. CBS 386.78]|nr:hypothetical protein QBC45DRAFT_404966 [Copromyces sp. CBS 386.78]
MHADLFACYERERAVEEVRKELEDTKKRLKLEYEAFQKRNYEAFQAAERQRIEVENLKARARKEKEAALARQCAEKQTSSAQRPKEVSFDSAHDRTYGLSPAPHDYRQPEQQNVKRPDTDNQQRSHHPSHDRSHSQNVQHVSNIMIAPYPQDDYHRQADQPKHHYPQYTHSVSHQNNNQRPTTGDSRRNHQAPVGLSGMPIGSSVASDSPALVPWDEKNQNTVDGYAASHGPQWQSHHDLSYPNASTAENKWSTPQIPTWNGPVLDSKATDKKWFASSATVRPASPAKEKWSLPPSPIPTPKQVDVRPPRETEEEKLRRELAEYKVKAAKLEADLERKKRVSGADSVATWQTGTKSIWEDPTKDISKDTPNEASMRAAQTFQSAAKPSFSRYDQQETPKDSTTTNLIQGPSKPAVLVQNLRRREPSVDKRGDRPASRASTHTRYFEADEHISSNEERTPKPTFSQSNTHYGLQKPSLESIPRYVPPTPHRHPSPPPKLPPTPPRGSGVPTPATLRPAPKYTADARQEIQTPKLTGIPGSWRDELPPKDALNDRWPANVSTPSMNSPAMPVSTAKETYKPERYVPAPKDVPPPGSYLSADTRHQQPGYAHPIPTYAVPQPGPSYPIHHPLYASYSNVYGRNQQHFPLKDDVEAGPSGHKRPFGSWADPSAAQSLGSTQAPTRKDKGKGKALY